MVKNKNLISLKDAAKETGYSADYIGQLIRAGKIPGKQVYCNIAWMTTVDDVLKHKEQSENKISNKKGFFNSFELKKRRLAMELGVFKLFFNTFRNVLPALTVVFVSFLLLGFFIIYSIFDKKIAEQPVFTPQVSAQINSY